MNQRIKTFIITIMATLFAAIAIFGITTSLAEEVYDMYTSFNTTPTVNFDAETYSYKKGTTTINDIINAFNEGKTLTNISQEYRDKSSFIYCKERNWYLYPEGRYEVNKNKDGEILEEQFPGTDPKGYTKAYILVAPGYDKYAGSYSTVTEDDERQYAWYFAIGQRSGEGNDLYKIATAYQNYKNSEKDVKVTDNGNTTTSGNNTIYGPIKVTYSYASITSGSHSDEWGGFYYAFEDENGNIINDKVQLCTLSGSTYTPITSYEDENTGYYQVKTADYNNKNLYMVTSDNTASSITIKVKENKIDYTATTISVYGQYFRAEGGLSLCSSCRVLANNATEDKAIAVKEGKLLKIPHTYTVTTVNGQTATYDDYEYYKYDEKTVEYVYRKSTQTKPLLTHFFRINGTNYSASSYDKTIPIYKNVMACWDCQSETCEHTKTSLRKYAINVYNFILFEGCNTSRGEKANDCGEKFFVPGYYHSQALDFIKTSNTETSNDLKLNVTIELNKSINVKKVWSDNDNANKNRPESIKIKLYADGKDTGKTLTLNANNKWEDTFTDLRITENGKAIAYSIEEVSVTGYTTKMSGDAFSGYTVTNTEDKVNISVTKKWEDGNNRDGIRPASVTITLYADGTSTGKTLTLNSSNSWKSSFTGLPKCKNGKTVTYTVKESGVPTGYTSVVTGDVSSGFTITNKHGVEKIGVKVTKVWNDVDDLDDLRPSSITVTLCANGTSTGKTVTLNSSNNWTATFSNLYKNENGTAIAYTVEELVAPTGYTSVITGDMSTGFTITNTHEPHYDGYIEITGKVWHDGKAGKSNTINGTLGSEDKGIEGIKVTLKDASGKQFDATSMTTTNSDGTYTIKVNYDNTQKVYKLYEDVETVTTKLKTAYVEFEYDGYKYTTVKTGTTGANTSKAIENETTRNSFDSAHSKVTPTTQSPDNWTDKTMTAVTKNVISFETYTDTKTENRSAVIKYCNGKGKSLHTNINSAWQAIQKKNYTCSSCSGKGHVLRTYDVPVKVIQNVNLGLFEREQPNVAIFSDISKVEVEMKGQKYTYLYNVRSNENNNVGLQVKFENKDTYTYRRPVNPADIAYINSQNDNAMSVKVTYEVKVANLSTTLTSTIHNIINNYDSRYTLDTTGWNVTGGTEFNTATYNGDLNITLAPETESETIYLTYTVSVDAIKALLNEDATLNNAVEIESYSTAYGANTLYAEQRTGGRTNKPYGGYDTNSHPGNAGIHINNDGRLAATKLEDDTDLAPSFVLCQDKDYYKILSGNVWEDTDANSSDEYRLGDGKKAGTEKNVANVRVELYKVKDDGTLEIAKLYSIEEDSAEVKTKDAITYTDSNGNYSFGDGTYSVLTDKYIIKFIYGEGIDDSKTSTINNVPVNIRNYKSTIIRQGTIIYNMFKGTSSNDEWYLNIGEGLSIAVDNVEKRTEITDLQYGTYDDKFTMEAWSKPFMMQLEFNPSETKESQVPVNGNTIFGNECKGFDFGIIERARENLFVEKTVDYVKVTLANGQVLTEGNPNTQELNYAKPIGFSQTINSGTAARNALDKQLLIEMDAELIQGAQLQIKYRIQVTNNSEKDYEYSQGKTEFYYFGTNNEGSPEIKGSIKYLVDYADKDINYEWENPNDWTLITARDLRTQGLISDETYKYITEKEYIAYGTTKYSELERGKTIKDYATASKLVANEDENVYENHLEILKIDARIARTTVGKQYKPGNYVPSLQARQVNADINNEQPGLHEQDDDRVKVIITPPTGITNYITTYIIATLIGLIIIAVGIVFIKKKVIKK